MTLLALVAPARWAGSSAMVTLTVPLPSAVRIALPSVCDSVATGMVTAGAVPRTGGAGPVVLLTISTAIAPLAWALAAWVPIEQVAVRSSRATLPARVAALTNGVS